jgi:hypothetical protein
MKNKLPLIIAAVVIVVGAIFFMYINTRRAIFIGISKDIRC